MVVKKKLVDPPFTEENPNIPESILIQVERDEYGQPTLVINGTVAEERAVLLLQMAAHMSLENLTYSYIPGMANAFPEEEEASENPAEMDEESVSASRKIKDAPQA